MPLFGRFCAMDVQCTIREVSSGSWWRCVPSPRSLGLALELSTIDQHEPESERERGQEVNAPEEKLRFGGRIFRSFQHGKESSGNAIAKEHPGEARYRHETHQDGNSDNDLKGL